MTCKDPAYQEFCGQIYRYVPLCEEMDKKSAPPSLPCSYNPNETGLILQIFELGRLFVKKKMVKFHPQGVCMYPCIKPGDTLHIEPRSVGQIKVGDIAVYRRFNRLFTHRTIDKGIKDGQSYIITRPDIAKFNNDGPSFDKDILGIVTQIERKAEILDTAKKDCPLLKRFFLNIYLQYYHLKQYLGNKVIYIITYLQQFKAYRKFVRFLFINSKKKIEFSLQVPLGSKINSRFFRKMSLEEFLNLQKGKSPAPRWMITLSVNSRPAGFLSFVFKPKNCPFSGWWLSEAKVRIRYRGTDPEERLLRQANNLLNQSGIQTVFVSVFKDLHLERKIFKNMDFKEISTHKDNFVKDRNKETVERVMMKRVIVMADLYKDKALFSRENII